MEEPVLQVPASSMYVCFRSGAPVREFLLNALGVRGSALDMVLFVHNMFGPPSWPRIQNADNGDAKRKKEAMLYLPLCFVLSPETPQYIMGPVQIKPEKLASSTLCLEKDLFQTSIFFRTRERDAYVKKLNGTLVIPEYVEKTFSAPAGYADRYTASALRIVQLAHMFQTPTRFHLQKEGACVNNGLEEKEHPCNLASMHLALIEAVRHIALDSTLSADPENTGAEHCYHFSDALDRAIGHRCENDAVDDDRAIHKEKQKNQDDRNIFFLGVMECACYVAGTSAVSCSKIRTFCETHTTLRAALVVLGFESFVSNSESKGTDPTDPCPHLDIMRVQEYVRKALDATPPDKNPLICARNMLDHWMRYRVWSSPEVGVGSGGKVSLKDSRLLSRYSDHIQFAQSTLGRMHLLKQEALKILSPRVISGNSRQIAPLAHDTDRTETDTEQITAHSSDDEHSLTDSPRGVCHP